MSIACLPPELWHRVIRHLTIMEDTCSLAMVSKYFYKLVKMDFKRECYNHVVYRLKGETWVYAFSDLGSRSYNTILTKIDFYRDNAICCPFTGKIALAINDAYVLLTNIDFGLGEFTILDFSSYINKVTRVNMIHRGKELLVYSLTVLLVYDLMWMQVKMPPYDRPRNKGYQTALYDTVLELYTKKEYKICARRPFGIVSYLNMYDTTKYFAVHTKENQLAIFEAETGKERGVICAWTHELSVFVINDNDSVVVTGM
ncbi:unnamed protein product [Bursaphelenchus okinawaensis]|uniref:F-box domain-containing protein n=1 Tax=Bursaphelenchus okinawaensis TaxID=465554 RepID=A0A811JQN9_9BILA|nr:unnamed protein product [Bursaphelenchus okinawaensis]CAG9078605.1 unnamed protein product [Bursaphelenchus okinawaensis]